MLERVTGKPRFLYPLSPYISQTTLSPGSKFNPFLSPSVTALSDLIPPAPNYFPCFTHTSRRYFVDSLYCLVHLGGFLGCRLRSVHISSNIGHIVELSRPALNTLPNLTSGRGCSLTTNKRIHTCSQMGYLTFDKSALSEASAQEGCIQNQENPGAFRENDSSQEEAEP